jgi:hypothetical protein
MSLLSQYDAGGLIIYTKYMPNVNKINQLIYQINI